MTQQEIQAFISMITTTFNLTQHLPFFTPWAIHSIKYPFFLMYRTPFQLHAFSFLKLFFLFPSILKNKSIYLSMFSFNVPWYMNISSI